jgi:hypothetical protein
MKKIIAFAVILSGLYSCTKIITPALENADPQIIIQGAISDTAGPYFVTIAKSVGFYADNIYPNVSGAIVTITDATAGVNDVLTETTPGVYATHTIQGTHGNTYRLTVMLNGNTYTATSTMPQQSVLLDSISFDASDTKRVRAQVNFQDPVNIVNFYKYSVYINGVNKRFQTFDDRLSAGRYIRDKIDNDTAELKMNDWIQLSLVGVDKNVYTYLHEAERIAYQNGSLSAPATPTTNIAGGCLGYFSAQTVTTKRKQVIY